MLPAGWEVAYSRTDGKPYYYNKLTNTSQFEFPEAATKTGAAALRNSRLRPELADLARVVEEKDAEIVIGNQMVQRDASASQV